MLEPNSYYRVTTQWDEFVPGTLLRIGVYKGSYRKEYDTEYAAMSAEKGVEHFYGKSEDILEHCEYEPNGEAIFDQMLLAAISSINDVSVEHAAMQAQTAMLENSAALALEQPSGENGTALAVVGGGEAKAVDIRAGLAEGKRSINQAQKNMEQAQARMLSFINEKKAIAMAKVAEMQEMMANLGEAIGCVNLYLGEGETVAQIREGVPADAEVPITIRQDVLYMDEETANFEDLAECGGMDFKNLSSFDKWVLFSEEHLNAILPEQKGIVSLRVRRESKNYSDNAFENAFLNQANKVTYFLIRNGENLYRVITALNVGSRLYPTHDEYQEHFEKSEYNWESKQTTTEFIRPGSPEYMKALKRANSHQRHYLRIMLIIQGLLDRTDIFKPMVRERVNIMNPQEYADTFVFKRDGENMLDSGRPSYWDWMRELSKKMEVGQRIVGKFSGQYGEEFREDRLHPRTASRPLDNQLYVLEERLSTTSFKILYDRSDKIYRRYEPWSRYTGTEVVDPTRRASCKIMEDDNFIIPIDLVEEHELEWYINSRKDRHNYRTMLPLMRVALDVKKVEREAEAPFRDVLVSFIARETGDEPEAVADKVDALIKWWKFKNRTHRALSADESKATRMIADEYKLQKRRTEQRAGKDADMRRVMEQVLATGKTYLLIAHKKDNDYVALVSAERQDNVFVHEEHWKSVKGKAVLKETRNWSVVTTQVQRWEVIYRNDSLWEKWNTNAFRNDHLSGPEIAQVREQLLKQIDDTKARGDWPSVDTDFWERRDPVIPLQITYQFSSKKFWASAWDIRTRADRRVMAKSKSSSRECMMRYEVTWKRVKGEIQIYPSLGFYTGGLDDPKDGFLLVWDSVANRREMAQDMTNNEKYDKACRAMYSRSMDVVNSITGVLYAKHELAHKTRFLQDGGLEEDWPKTRDNKMQRLELGNHGLNPRVAWLVTEGYEIKDFQGKLSDWVYTESEKTGFDAWYAAKAERRRRNFWGRQEETRPLEKILGIRINVVEESDED